MKIYAVDYGEQHCGIAVSDDNIKIAVPKDTVKTVDLQSYFQKLELKKNSIVVFGLPISLSGRYSKQTCLTIDAAIKLKKTVECKIFFVDERLTTSSLYNEFKGKVSSKKIKLSKDQNSSVLILSIFLSNTKNAIELEEKRIFELPEDFSNYKDILIYDTALNLSLEKENISIFARDPWIFWFYCTKNIKSTSLISDLKNYYDLVILENNKKDEFNQIINFSKIMCL
ncbi:RuvX/YqgF family protein [Petrotoga sp. 9PWA.NaAc.5.4]|uniref:RuvX/YqgF family protein n=1 Tax=Petrotoga sp. 9PWA.NaAc.5.4 TaxID=1434328 RepID=UPI001304E4B4|nr:RuvX/YqgF family protein [Petrotoga sp. 9PWA.NaAc.5.4]